MTVTELLSHHLIIVPGAATGALDAKYRVQYRAVTRPPKHRFHQNSGASSAVVRFLGVRGPQTIASAEIIAVRPEHGDQTTSPRSYIDDKAGSRTASAADSFHRAEESKVVSGQWRNAEDERL